MPLHEISDLLSDELLDDRLHLFVDDHGLLGKRNVERVLSRPSKHVEPVVRQDRPWESPWVYAWGSVLREPGSRLLRMWYETMGHGAGPGLIRTCYAESADGVNWRKPDLGRYAFGGYAQTNILSMAAAVAGTSEAEGDAAFAAAGAKFLGEGRPLHEFVTHYDGSNIVRDEHEPDPQKRYKYIAGMWRRGSKLGFTHHLMTSPDGIRWSPPEEVLRGTNDGTKLVWDARRRVWVLTWLSWAGLETGENVRYPELSESPDLHTWQHIGKPFALDEEDQFGRRLQGHFLLPFAYGDQYLGLASMIHTKEGWCQTYLVSSRDGRTWERPLRRDPWLSVGGEDHFDAGSAEAAINPPIPMGEDLLIYYCGRARRHWAPSACTSAIGLLRLRRDRFAGLANGGWFNRDTNNLASNAGEVLTRPVEVTGPALYVNVRCRVSPSPNQPPHAQWGVVRAELLDEQQRPLPGFTLDESVPFRGDTIRARMTWAGGPDLAALRGQRVHVRFSLNMATIYAYTFR